MTTEPEPAGAPDRPSEGVPDLLLDRLPDSRHRDGNALAGSLAEILGIDPTTTVLTCSGCGRSAAFAEQPVYSAGPGEVMRCGFCAEVVARVVRTPTDAWLDLRGARSWRIPLGS